ncbi:proline and serine-rich protein 3 isoform X2 [Synchiropus splendidus]|uniref:proline and serine-rich protein 3 isoform X2 n=1 Tax=Synchiropus splendidus TaxID=270530 RepID=UPI00237EB99F|nr:proline and serine-rich protein 3 isoform X2 [Synchiropus splendidus]
MKPRKKSSTPQTPPKVGKTSSSKSDYLSGKNTKQTVIPKHPSHTEEQGQWIAVSSQGEPEVQPLVNTDVGSQQDSVLAKYIDRFRYGQPQSREQRQQMASVRQEKSPFWWTTASSLPPVSTTETRYEEVLDVDQHERSQSILSDVSLGDLDDLEILQLQERASRLLRTDGDCSVYDDSPPVSSEGLGCTDFHLPSFDDPIQRLSSASLLKTTRLGSDGAPTMPSGVPARPEDDILFQWRLRRKMERAEQPHLSFDAATHGWQRLSLHQSPADGHDYKEKQPEAPSRLPQVESTDPIRPPVLATFHMESVAHVPSHMYLLCDILPCPVRSAVNRQVEPPEQSGPCPHTTPEEAVNLMGESKHIPAGSLTQSKPVEALPRQQNKTDKRRKDTSSESRRSNTKQKKPTRCSAGAQHAELQSTTNDQSAHHRLPKKAMPSTVLQQKERRQDSSRDRRAGGDPPSPVHSALQQVVSEVLFPTSAPASAGESESPPSAPPEPITPSYDAQKSVEVISQLLQEAEDSDEKEFEDDPLLQDLRRQRRCLKEQISAVALLLEEFPHEQRRCV